MKSGDYQSFVDIQEELFQKFNKNKVSKEDREKFYKSLAERLRNVGAVEENAKAEINNQRYREHNFKVSKEKENLKKSVLALSIISGLGLGLFGSSIAEAKINKKLVEELLILEGKASKTTEDKTRILQLKREIRTRKINLYLAGALSGSAAGIVGAKLGFNLGYK